MAHSPPKLTGSVHVRDDRETLFDDLGMTLMGAASDAVGQRGVFHLALSGGSTPERFHMRLVIDPRFRVMPWVDTHVWLVDERCVPVEDERSNFRMIRESLLDHVPLRRGRIHPMPVSDKDPAAAYERELRETFDQPEGVPRLDLVLLGMGEDGHTASLFPHSSALSVRDRLIANNSGEHVTPPPRVTMTYPLLNAARQIIVLVTGENKARAIQRVAAQFAERPNPDELPVTGIDPEAGELTWYLDSAAAGDSAA